MIIHVQCTCSTCTLYTLYFNWDVRVDACVRVVHVHECIACRMCVSVCVCAWCTCMYMYMCTYIGVG